MTVTIKKFFGFFGFADFFCVFRFFNFLVFWFLRLAEAAREQLGLLGEARRLLRLLGHLLLQLLELAGSLRRRLLRLLEGSLGGLLRLLVGVAGGLRRLLLLEPEALLDGLRAKAEGELRDALRRLLRLPRLELRRLDLRLRLLLGSLGGFLLGELGGLGLLLRSELGGRPRRDAGLLELDAGHPLDVRHARLLALGRPAGDELRLLRRALRGLLLVRLALGEDRRELGSGELSHSS